ncbi:septal ring lytic transglycosylase RlpA family protein [Neisseria zalophi]|uniref:Endolytic peptidoglycan transglycosylase RlpA n=1 Tax=Neisseria zalophi TaxID=640030 RepID=A0A5J6PXX0_9NEIS|nr:septal ring lytic transglycosylase RlpA family protein [Neisseria zalophi]
MTQTKHTLFSGIFAATALGLLFSGQANADAIVKVEKLNRAANMSYKVAGKRYTPRKKVSSFSQVGRASWYGKQFHGRKTSSGERYDMNEMTAAHKTLPIPSYARVTNLQNGKSVVVRINDRGPFHGKRVVDVSKAAAKRLGFMHTGTAKVRVEQIVPEKRAENAVQNKARTIHVNGSQNTSVKADTQARLQQSGGHLKLAKLSAVF